jgi:hypothetical protein
VTATLDRSALLRKLDPIEPEDDESRGEGRLRRISLAAALLSLAEIDHEHEYQLCRSVATHLLGSVPEPDDLDLGD